MTTGGGTARDEREWWKRRGFVEVLVVERAGVEARLGNGGRLPEVEVRFHKPFYVRFGWFAESRD